MHGFVYFLVIKVLFLEKLLLGQEVSLLEDTMVSRSIASIYKDYTTIIPYLSNVNKQMCIFCLVVILYICMTKTKDTFSEKDKKVIYTFAKKCLQLRTTCILDTSVLTPTNFSQEKIK